MYLNLISSVADDCAEDRISIHIEGDMTASRSRPAKEDGKQNRLENSPGQTLQQVFEPVDTLKCNWSATRPWKVLCLMSAT